MGGFLAEDTAAGEGLSSPHSVWEARRQEAAHPPERRMAGFGPRAGRIQRAEQGHLHDACPLACPGGLESALAEGEATLSRDHTLPGRCSEHRDVPTA